MRNLEKYDYLIKKEAFGGGTALTVEMDADVKIDEDHLKMIQMNSFNTKHMHHPPFKETTKTSRIPKLRPSYEKIENSFIPGRLRTK